jgi:hypothetical protein
MTTQLFKTENCDAELIRFARRVTFDYLQQQHNKTLFSISEKLPANTPPPRMFFCHNLDTVYCLEFVPGKREVLLKELHYDLVSTTTQTDRTAYIRYLISDKHRVWISTPFTCDDELDDSELSNQMLSLLRLCKINKNDYLRDPNVLSTKFKS